MHARTRRAGRSTRHANAPMNDPVKRIVERFGLVPHPEGGYFKEIYRSELTVTHPGVPDSGRKTRPAGTLIYFLLQGSEFSAWHRVRWTDELWQIYAGEPLELHMIGADGGYERRILTTDLLEGEPTAVVPAGCWQAARLSRGTGWALGGCAVSPGFDFADFEMPGADELKRRFPRHEAIIDELTRT